MVKIIPHNEARQGRWGWHVLIVLVAALLLAFAVWGGVGFYGEMLDNGTPAADTAAPGG
ncbi:MAG: hypothetical protein ACTHNH_14560 [Mesorhizobium sp.]|uniref:hypothetical protein n=1 Tax=Phyllobacteriaceae TaxID=69277 RepID=UPI001454CC79|nr:MULTISPECIES: hypothetical protein [Mesorhizobium]